MIEEGEFKKRAKSCKEVHKIYEDYYKKPQEQFERYMLPKSLVSTEDIVEAEKTKQGGKAVRR
jgi:hypothetical protein